MVLDGLAVITRPGAASRIPEVASVAAALEAYRPIARIEAPGCLDGGDVLRVEKSIYVGLTSRTNPEGIEQLRRSVEPYGYKLTPLEVAVAGRLPAGAVLNRPLPSFK